MLMKAQEMTKESQMCCSTGDAEKAGASLVSRIASRVRAEGRAQQERHDAESEREAGQHEVVEQGEIVEDVEVKIPRSTGCRLKPRSPSSPPVSAFQRKAMK